MEALVSHSSTYCQSNSIITTHFIKEIQAHHSFFGSTQWANRNGKKNAVIAKLSNKYNERLPKIEPFFHILAHCVKVVIFISMSRNLH